MPARRTFSGLTQDFNRIAQENERLRRERDEAIEATDEVKKRNKRLKKALRKDKQKAADGATETLIPRPEGSAGRKTATDATGRTRPGYNLRDKMELSRPKDRKTYNEFREFIRRLIPGDRYAKYDDMGTLVTGSICAKASTALKKFPFLSKFQGQWPVEVVLRSYFTNRSNYKKSDKRKKVRTGLRAGSDAAEDDDDDGGQEGGIEGMDQEEEEEEARPYRGWDDVADEEDEDEEKERGYPGWDYDDERAAGGLDEINGEGANGDSDEEEEGMVVVQRKRKTIPSDESEDDTVPKHKRRKLIPTAQPAKANDHSPSDSEEEVIAAPAKRPRPTPAPAKPKAKRTQAVATRRSDRTKK